MFFRLARPRVCVEGVEPAIRAPRPGGDAYS